MTLKSADMWKIANYNVTISIVSQKLCRHFGSPSLKGSADSDGQQHVDGVYARLGHVEVL